MKGTRDALFRTRRVLRGIVACLLAVAYSASAPAGEEPRALLHLRFDDAAEIARTGGEIVGQGTFVTGRTDRARVRPAWLRVRPVWTRPRTRRSRKSLTLREIRYRIVVPGPRTRKIDIVTTLVDYLAEIPAQIANCEVANRSGRLEPRVLKRRRHGYPLSPAFQSNTRRTKSAYPAT